MVGRFTTGVAEPRRGDITRQISYEIVNKLEWLLIIVGDAFMNNGNFDYGLPIHPQTLLTQ